MGLDLLGLQSQKKYRAAQGQALEAMLKALLRDAPKAVPSSAVRALLRGMPAARVAKLIEILIDHLAKHPGGTTEHDEDFLGWTHWEHCKFPRPDIYAYWGEAWPEGGLGTPPYIFNACIAGQARIGLPTLQPWVGTYPSSTIGIIKEGEHPYFGGPATQMLDRWGRSKPGPVIYQPAESYQTGDPGEYPVSLPDWAPSIPEFAPLWLPSPPGGPRAAPKRHRVGSPYFETGPATRTSPVGLPGPDGYPGSRPGPSRSPETGPGGYPAPAPGTGTGHPPVTIDDLHADNTQVQVDGDGNTSRPRSTHHFAPPPRGVKEKKVAVGGAGKFGRFYGSLSEGKELVDDVWGALPDDVKGKRRKTVQQKLTDIWRNWDRLDSVKAVENIIWDKSVDRIIGAGAQAGRKAWRDYAPPGLRASRGPQLGFRYTQHALGRNHF